MILNFLTLPSWDLLLAGRGLGRGKTLINEKIVNENLK